EPDVQCRGGQGDDGEGGGLREGRHHRRHQGQARHPLRHQHREGRLAQAWRRAHARAGRGRDPTPSSVTNMRPAPAATLLLMSAHAFADAAVQDLAVKVEAVKDQVKNARDNIEIVEKQYSGREEQSDEAAREARFSDGEIKYLLGDYENAAVLFYDLVANKDFQKSKRYADALFYLADSL